MQKYYLTFILVLFCTIQKVSAQKFGYVDTKFILNKIPEYKEAQSELNQMADAWEKEIKEKYQELDRLYTELKAEEVLLTEDMLFERKEALKMKEDSVREYNNKVFGYEGLYFLKKQELIKPIQDKVFDAVEKVAQEQRLQVLFDKSGSLVLIYTNPIHDYTDYVLEELGLGDPSDQIR